VKIFPLLLIILLISAIVLPAGAEDPDYDNMLKKTQSLNITVPEKGTAVLGSKESMTQYIYWMNDSTDALFNLVNNVFDVFGLGNTSYAQDMKKALESGLALTPDSTEK
jgi:hypothetical protein